ncbi:hypothetical protein FPV67DRAFT_1671914 [Lyophyllum atratum]|nr:hypothetical protein FPV67DRAFT_1671914 [Lyophyllum atratum]
MVSSYKTSSRPTFHSSWHDPSAIPKPPMLETSAGASNTVRVHWWDSTTVHVTADSIFSPYIRLPACGFFTPSASFVSSTDQDLPWDSPELYKSYSDISELQTPVDDVGDETSAKNVRPLKRVLTITRVVGDSIRKRRGIEKMSSGADSVQGLGLAFSDCSMVPPAKQVQMVEHENAVDG